MSNLARTPAHLVGNAYVSALTGKAAQLRDALIQQTLKDYASWERSIDENVIRRHPELRIGTQDYMREVETFRGRIGDAFDWVVPAFETFGTPDPDDIDPAIEMLGTIQGWFDGEVDTTNNWTGANPALERVNLVGAEMIAGWRGSFTDNFIDHFVTPLATVLPNQRNLAQLVQEQLTCNKVIYIQRRQSAMDLLDASIYATQNLDNEIDADAAKWATIAAVAVGTTLGPFVAGWGIGLALMLDAGGTIAQGLVPDKEEKKAITRFNIGGRTTADVTANIMTAISALERDTYSQEQQVATALRDITRVIESLRRPSMVSNTSGPFSLERSALADATAAELTRNMQPKR
ncbi:hypothetical protein [Actinoplanes utahensis]|uniref:Uncharacterized protein n=1 Tax=Actinoplanes utahensis TaxID=1869 RepID=A0A0A6UVL5_ACTUT|nr:hypothetical protein [Actinoplanes utahensis]KHD78958.1 hypothetical protein MB27_02420 [Actinoplanes utahensis]GIF28062.1 hypothetical protein Aut01nite_10480 [Actinoplanes utahensis]